MSEPNRGLTEPVAHPDYHPVRAPETLAQHIVEEESEHAGEPSDDTSLEEAASTPGAVAPDPRHAWSDEG